MKMTRNNLTDCVEFDQIPVNSSLIITLSMLNDTLQVNDME